MQPPRDEADHGLAIDHGEVVDFEGVDLTYARVEEVLPERLTRRLRGIEITRLGKRHKAEPVIRLQTPRGETAYWIGPAGGAQDAGPGTDFHAVEHCKVSVTPLRLDLTHTAQLPFAREWLSK